MNMMNIIFISLLKRIFKWKKMNVFSRTFFPIYIDLTIHERNQRKD